MSVQLFGYSIKKLYLQGKKGTGLVPQGGNKCSAIYQVFELV